MADTGLPGVHVTKGTIGDFTDGIFGVNKANNSKAWRDAAAIVVASVAYGALKKYPRRSKKGSI
jgi:hypothetical protein